MALLSSKKYSVTTPKGYFNLFVAHHDNDIWLSCIVWYRKSGSWSKGQDVQLDFQLEQFMGKSEDEVFNSASSWIKNNLDPAADINLL